MRSRARSFWAGMLLLIVTVMGAPAQTGPSAPLYRDAAQPIEKRVADLLARMTLAEKIGQINMPVGYTPDFGKSIEEKLDGYRRFAAGQTIEGIGPGGGFFAVADVALAEGPRRQAEFFNQLQRIAIKQTRLGIPLLETEEGTHGLRCAGGTIFPEGPTLGSMWNAELIKKIYAAAAVEARAVGIHQLCTLVVEPNRDPRLGRNEEGYSEDPYLCSRYALAIVRGIQGGDVSRPDKAVAVLCHFPGQSEPVSGLERGAMEISERKLREVFLPPWIAGIRRAGALGIMVTYPTIDGVPAHASRKLLTRILRDELRFRGLALSEGDGIDTLVYTGVARNQKEAGQLALKAGVDVGISYESGYMLDLVESIREGRVPLALLDRAVARILRQKFRLGLFERPYTDPERAVNGIPREAHRRLALDAAREGIVLLKNDGNLLPLDKAVKSIAVIGPNADNGLNLCGDYRSRVVLQEIGTILDGVRGMVSTDTAVSYVKGCNILGDELDEIEPAAAVARKADVAVVVVGEAEWHSPEATDGEGWDAASLDLTGRQQDLIKAVHATGTPTVVVLVNGRPLSIRWTAEHVPAIVEAWLPGEVGGTAVAEVLFGDVNPSGKLPVTVPRHSGQLPVYYNHMPSKPYWLREHWVGRPPYVDVPATPLWNFGHGLSYTDFAYSDLVISPQRIHSGADVKVSFTVKNNGRRAGAEVAQLYVRDVVSSIVRPVQELRRFKKVRLKPGEERAVEFTLHPKDLEFLNVHLEPVIEPGTFRLRAGASSSDIRLRGEFEVIR